MPSEFSMMDLAWVGGFLEGEGSFSTSGLDNRSMTRRSLRVCAVQKGSDETLRRCQKIFGGKIHAYHDKNYPDNKYWRWGVSGHAAAAAMMTLYSFLSKRRKHKIEQALAAWKRIAVWGGNRTQCLRGHDLGERTNYGDHNHRRCKICARDRMRANRLRLRQEAANAIG